METSKGIFSNYNRDGGDSLAMSISQNIPIQDNFRFRSVIAIGNPIVDISAEVDKESIQK